MDTKNGNSKINKNPKYKVIDNRSNVNNTIFSLESESCDKLVTKEDKKGNLNELQLYTRRWFILILYVICMTCNAAQWLQYSIISHIVKKFYGVSGWNVEVTTMTSMFCFLLLSGPVSYIMNIMNLRTSALIGIIGTTIGSWTKVMSAYPDGFYMTLAGQILVDISQVFLITMPTKLISLWFGDKEVSLAVNIAMLGSQLGYGFGFIISPVLVKNHDNLDLIQKDLYYMFLYIAIFSTILSILVFLFFQAKPSKPPSLAQILQNSVTSKKDQNYFKTIKRLLTTPQYASLFLMSGLNNGCFNVYSTFINDLFIHYFPDNIQAAGNVGLTIVGGAMIAAILCGYILDKTKLYKPLTIILYYMGCFSLVLFTYAFESRSIYIVYVSSLILGFFWGGFTPVSFDLATEITYPESEVVTSTIMNVTYIVYSIFLATSSSWCLQIFGCFTYNLWYAVMLFFGASVMAGQRMELRRHNLNKLASNNEDTKIGFVEIGNTDHLIGMTIKRNDNHM